MHRLFLIGFLCISGMLHANPKGIGLRQPVSRVFLVNIGINKNIGTHYCLYCDRDVAAMQQRFEADSSVFHFPLQVFSFINNRATFENINTTFAYLAENTTRYDKIVLYYSGISFPVNNPVTGKPENRFLLGNAERVDDKTVAGQYFTIGNLKTWLDKLAAVDFLLISDAGPTDTYIKDFLENLTYINSVWQQVDDKQRIFLFPQVAGYDNRISERGYFSEILTETDTDKPLIHLLNPAKQANIFAAIKSSEYRLLNNKEWFYRCSVKLFNEQEFSNDYAFLFSQTPVTRGEPEDIEVDEPAGAPVIPRQYALVIGVDRYTYWDKLNNPAADAKAIASLLSDKYGFEVNLLNANPTLKDITRAIEKLKEEKLNGPYDRLFVFFAGHGYFDKVTNTGHLVASDTRKAADDPNHQTFVQHNYLMNTLERLPCRHVLLMIDACYSGSIQRAINFKDNDDCDYKIPVNWSSLYAGLTDDQFIRRNIACPTRRYITSGGEKYTVPDGASGMHSPFAAFFIDLLKNGEGKDRILTFTDLLPGTLRLNPKPRTGRFGNDSETGEFMFIAKK